MKKNFGLILAIALGLSTLLLTIAFQAGWVKANPFFQSERAPEPGIVSYQGQIWEGDVPYNGDGYFKFIILDGKGEFVWSNDGDHEPKPVPMPVDNGLFSVLLGDLTLPNMSSPLTADVFANPGAVLQVWFSPDGDLFTQMPDQKIASVPYALQAQVAIFADQATNAANATNANNANNLGNVAAALYQLRVTGTCPAGQAVKQVNADGSVSCESIPQLPTFSINTLDSTNNVGSFTSIAIGTDGLGLISYYKGTPIFDLKVAHCSNAACSTASTYTLDSTGDVGYYTAIAIGTDGLGLISYYDTTNDDLKVAHCSNTACSSASTYTLDSTGNVGSYTAIAIGADGLGLISYHDSTNGDLKVAHCNNAACSSGATSNILDSTGKVGDYTSIAIGSDGLGLISYYDETNGDLKVAHCSNAACSSASTFTLDSTYWVGSYTSIAIGTDGLGLISYQDGDNADLRIAHCNDIACSSASTSTLDSTGNVGYYTAIAIGMDGFGLISYRDLTNADLRVAHCSNTACSNASTYTLDSTDIVGYYTSIAIGTDGLGLISYWDQTNGDLKVAHCSNNFCMPIDWGN